MGHAYASRRVCARHLRTDWRGALSEAIGWNELPPLETDGAKVAHRAPWIGILAVFAALCVVAGAASANASREGLDWAVPGFYAAMAAMALPPTILGLHPASSRGERLASVIVVTLALFAMRLVREPDGFIDHDEFLHWTTAEHILETGRLFSPNALLPVSPRYPGLEIIATALTSLSGLDVFAAGSCLMATCRVTFMLALFLTYERVSGSARIAACGCLVYTGCSTFLVFDTQFSYESLAVVFMASVLLASARSVDEGRSRHAAYVIAPLVAGLAVTHHMTAYFTAALLLAMAVLEGVRERRRSQLGTAVLIGLWALAAPLLWSYLMGNPGGDYLGPVLASGIREVGQLLSFTGGRKFFVSADGHVAPAWQRYVTIASVGLICLGLATGFLRAFALGGLTPGAGRLNLGRLRTWDSSLVILLTLLTMVFPLAILFRLTRSGWEIGNRIGPFSFIGVSFVCAVGVVSYWQRATRFVTLRTSALAVAGVVILIGGVISAEGPRILVPAKFEVSADSASIGPMAIDAARWARRWLGERNLFASDRINRLLLSTYGRQDVASSLQDGFDVSDVILAPHFGPKERGLLSAAGIDFLTLDRRITTDLPSVGVYFDGGDRDNSYLRPPAPGALLKFNDVPWIGRVFDDGDIVTYDVRAARENKR